MKKFLKVAVCSFAAGFLIAGSPIAENFLPKVSAAYQGEIIAAPNVAVVSTRAGKLQGYIHKGIYNYKGVQYAKAERFMPPQKIDSWSGIKTAINYGKVAPQLIDEKNDIFPPHWYSPHWEPRNYPQSEDCQNLNIWTPNINDGKKRPVMVWLHGGGYFMGSAQVEDVYDGENLARKGDVVVVSINHRLNSLGFLDLSAYGEKYKTSANNGILDIVAALEWIQENIENFGGDKNNVTLFGQSGGGAKILSLTAMPAAKNLFHKMIIQSGSVENMGMTLPTQETSRRVAELTLQNLNLSAAEVDKLQKISYAELSAAANKAYLQASKEFGAEKMYQGDIGWSPIIDGEIILQNPVTDGFSENAKNIPLLIGTVANEWTTINLWQKMEIAQTDNKNNWTDEQIEQKLREKFGANTEKIKSAFREAYPNKPIANALYVDSWQRTRAVKTAKIKSDQAAPVYNYIFAWETPIMGGFAMAYHCSEIPFAFNNIELSAEATGATKNAYALAEKISQAWINFARTGNPNTQELPKWEKFTRESGATMIFDDKSALRYHHDENLMKILEPNYK
ncbi:MAG: carboxylesterase/lipase family protein [Selenomonadaceae bacterium]|nr:carboxylesterase/lipase family protein [Selenomonadaceae bacterium]